MGLGFWSWQALVGGLQASPATPTALGMWLSSDSGNTVWQWPALSTQVRDPVSMCS